MTAPWLQICQGLMLVGFIINWMARMYWAVAGRKAMPKIGYIGVITVTIWSALTLAVLIRSGALSTIVGYP